MTAEIVLTAILSSIRMLNRMVTSAVSMSFEKRLRIRPKGVVSKKAMGAFIICHSMPSWTILDARKQARFIKIDEISVKQTAKQKQKTDDR